ncbi:MAG: 2-phospho-L-lactate transferase CofD family protein [Candidatus Dormibacterales bacterium]
MNVVVLAGGTGGALLAAGISSASPEARLTVVANTADDDEFFGLLVCPDVDATIYRLAGIFNGAAGYGQKDDTFNVLDAVARAGGDSWFRLGDRDFATHLTRNSLLRSGLSLTQATLELCRRHGITAQVLPMTDEPVRTRFLTDGGPLSFQEYFVRERLGPKLERIEFEGLDAAQPSSEVLAALAGADLVIIGPSNPLISVAPILRLVASVLPKERTVAVTPIVGGASLKGPTVDMMVAMGHPATPVEVARMYIASASVFVLDQRDRELSKPIERLGYRTIVCDTVMKDGGRDLAGVILSSV